MEKVKAGYRREMNHNYMIIEALNADPECYESRMLSGNTIEGLLKFRQKITETGLEFYYEITSKQPLSRLLEGRLISYEEIREILLSAARTLSRTEEFLLKEEQILLEPEFIYVEPEHFSLFFCILPGYSRSFPEAFTGLLQYVLEKVDHQDHRSVVLAYGLYHESLKENYGMEDLLRYLASVESGKTEWREKGKKQVKNENGGEKKLETEPLQEELNDIWKEPEIPRFVRDEPEKFVSERPLSRTENPRKRNKNSFSILKTVGLLLLMESVLYFMQGEAGIRRYGAVPVIAAAVGYLILTIVQMARGSESKGENELEERTGQCRKNGEDQYKTLEKRDISRQEKAEKGEQEELGILFQSLDDDILPEESVWEDRNTQLLTGTSEKEKHCAALESLSKDRSDIEIPYVPFLIGKHKEMNDCILDYPTVSRLHLRIDQKEEVYIFTDMNSTNGTIVNGYKLEANETVSVKEGDSIQIAGLSYRFREFE